MNQEDDEKFNLADDVFIKLIDAVNSHRAEGGLNNGKGMGGEGRGGESLRFKTK